MHSKVFLLYELNLVFCHFLFYYFLNDFFFFLILHIFQNKQYKFIDFDFYFPSHNCKCFAPPFCALSLWRLLLKQNTSTKENRNLQQREK